VIKQACRQILEWKDQGLHDCVIAINLSSIQLMQVDLADQIFDILDSYAIPPRLIELEITETALMNNIHTAMKSLQRLHSRGMSIAIDDFGTGYSSFSHLKNLPINCLKIDRTFIKDICEDENDKKIVQTLVYMAHSMDMTVVAEGVEEKQQYDLLTQYSCNLIQGYLLSKPISADAIVKMVNNPQNYLKLLS
jgi:EAL domain-containing protein (putative c-di-GMP-specific phosphodiesterase class I)